MAQAEGRRAALLRRAAVLHRARRDDPQPRFLLRDRCGGEGQESASPCCAFTGNGRTMNTARSPMAWRLPNRSSSGSAACDRRTTAAAGAGDRGRRLDHP